MKIFNPNTLVATAKEMKEGGLFPHPTTDTDIILWINWNWDPKSKEESFAPIAQIFSQKGDATHKIKGEEMFFKLPKLDGGFMFQTFINNFVPIERL